MEGAAEVGWEEGRALGLPLGDAALLDAESGGEGALAGAETGSVGGEVGAGERREGVGAVRRGRVGSVGRRKGRGCRWREDAGRRRVVGRVRCGRGRWDRPGDARGGGRDPRRSRRRLRWGRGGSEVRRGCPAHVCPGIRDRRRRHPLGEPLPQQGLDTARRWRGPLDRGAPARLDGGLVGGRDARSGCLDGRAPRTRLRRTHRDDGHGTCKRERGEGPSRARVLRERGQRRGRGEAGRPHPRGPDVGRERHRCSAFGRESRPRVHGDVPVGRGLRARRRTGGAGRRRGRRRRAGSEAVRHGTRPHPAVTRCPCHRLLSAVPFRGARAVAELVPVGVAPCETRT